MARMTMTQGIAGAAAIDAANAQMRKSGRRKWSRDDYGLAIETSARLMQQHGTYCQQLAADDAMRALKAARPSRKNYPF